MFDLWHEIMEEAEAAIPVSLSELSALEWREIGECNAIFEKNENTRVFGRPLRFALRRQAYEDKERFVEMVNEALLQRAYYKDMWDECEGTARSGNEVGR